jgi:hypothetical protein
MSSGVPRAKRKMPYSRNLSAGRGGRGNRMRLVTPSEIEMAQNRDARTCSACHLDAKGYQRPRRVGDGRDDMRVWLIRGIRSVYREMG